jgi:protein-tyrosine-phosphatase
MTRREAKVLFLSTGNATRGLLAEGFLPTLSGDQFDVASAGVELSDLNPWQTKS